MQELCSVEHQQYSPDATQCVLDINIFHYKMEIRVFVAIHMDFRLLVTLNLAMPHVVQVVQDNPLQFKEAVVVVIGQMLYIQLVQFYLTWFVLFRFYLLVCYYSQQSQSRIKKNKK